MAKRLTRHNGRAGKSGVYKSTHNDRTFNTEHADHIDGERISQNIYWDCFRGVTYPAQQDGEVSFADVERAFYLNRYSDYLDGQHERNAKRRHSERDRSVDDLLADKRFCPEETIYQIGTMEDSVSPVTSCQGLFNTVHRIFKKSTQQKPGAKWLPACSCGAYSCAIIWRTSSRSIRLILSSIVSVLVSLKCAHTR